MKTPVIKCLVLASCLSMQTAVHAAVPEDVLRALKTLENSVTAVTVTGTITSTNREISNESDAAAQATAAKSGGTAVRVNNMVTYCTETAAQSSRHAVTSTYVNVSEDKATSQPHGERETVMDSRLAVSELKIDGQLIHYLEASPGEKSHNIHEKTPVRTILAGHFTSDRFAEAFENEWKNLTWEAKQGDTETVHTGKLQSKAGLFTAVTFRISNDGHLNGYKEFVLTSNGPKLLHERSIGYSGGHLSEVSDRYYSEDKLNRSSQITIESIKEPSKADLHMDVASYLRSKKPARIVDYRTSSESEVAFSEDLVK